MGEVIRRTKNGKFLGYYLRFYESGRRRVIASKQTSHAEARRMLLELEARIARREVGIAELPNDRLTVEEIIEKFISEYSKPKLKDLAKYKEISRSVLKRARAILGRHKAGTLSKRDVAQFRDRISKELEPGSVRAVLVRLSSVFSWAVSEGLMKTNPCRGVEKPNAPQSLDFFTRDEVKKLLDESRDRAVSVAGWIQYVGIAIVVHTGLRKGELLGLRWTDMDFETLRLSVAKSYRTLPKNGKERHLRLPSKLVPLLREWQKQCPLTPENLVIPAGKGKSRMGKSNTMIGLKKLMQELGMRHIERPWHLLRHTFASHFVMSGGNILALQKILGHSDLKMTMIYAHLAPDFLGQEMERISFD